MELHDKDGNDLYPEIRRRAAEKNATEKHDDMVRFEYIKHLGYYCTESSEHNAEYNPLFIKSRYPEMIENTTSRWTNTHADVWSRSKAGRKNVRIF